MRRIVKYTVLLGSLLAMVGLAVSSYSASLKHWTLSRVRQLVDREVPIGSSRKRVEAYLRADPFSLGERLVVRTFDPPNRTIYVRLQRIEDSLVSYTDIVLSFRFSNDGKLVKVDSEEQITGL